LRPLALCATLTILTSVVAVAQRWDVGPLRSPTPIPRDGLPPERAAFFTWLVVNSGKLPNNAYQRVQERLYTYISQLAKDHAGAFPPASDTAAFNLFRAAAQIGVPGADRVARALYAHPDRLPVPTPIPGFDLAFRPPLFALTSDDSTWGVCFPYYFMAAPGGRQTPANGVSTELVVLSTLVAPDRSPAGSSQATIFIAAAPVADSLKHVTTWLKQFGVGPVTSPPESAAGSWFASPAAEPMRRLATIRRLPQRVLVIFYLGQPGTFETNRPHFFNLLATLRDGRCAA